ncbi:MAG: two-component system LytT family response regulator [Flavobacteriales bacterium]|jgi:two-component system LytT family response regulator
MIKLRTIIVDDEPLALAVLNFCLNDFPEIEIVARCKNGREAIDATIELEPDLIFLDIQMPGKNGFEVVKSLQNDVLPMVIFVTTHLQYALEAFDVHAVDYVPKPLDEDRLKRAVKRALERHTASQTMGTNKQSLLGLIDSISSEELPQTPNVTQTLPADGASTSPKKITFRDGEKVIIVIEDEIDWIDAAGDYMCIHIAGETHIIRSTLKELLSKLTPKKFTQIHRSTIINTERIREIKHLTKGDYILRLSCGERLKTSRSYNGFVKSFRSKLE